MPMDLQDIQQRRREATFEFYGSEMHVEFWQERLTREFRADCARLNRMILRMRQRSVALRVRLDKAEAEPDTPEAAEEDAAADAAYQQLLADDQILKGEIDAALHHILASWDVTEQGVPAAITMETLARLDTEFEAAVINAVLGETKPLGEANGRASMNGSPYTLKQRVSASTKKASSSKHHRG